MSASVARSPGLVVASLPSYEFSRWCRRDVTSYNYVLVVEGHKNEGKVACNNGWERVEGRHQLKIFFVRWAYRAFLSLIKTKELNNEVT